jgi:tRNA threonylcarbamoyladenosine biosynthesis protein TsaE
MRASTAKDGRSLTPILTNDSLDFISNSAEQTRRVGERLGRLLHSGDLICLEGDLGAGKTCLTQGIGRGLRVGSAITSPTFIIVNEYQLPERSYKLYHVDLYRLETAAEAQATGLEELFFGDGICVIEWAERVREILPADRLWVTLRYVDETKRGLQFEAHGERFHELLDRFRQDTFGV